MTETPTGRIPYGVVALAALEEAEVKPLADRIGVRLTEFRCGRSPHLQSFARSDVRKYEAHGHSRTYVIVTQGDEGVDVAGFFTVGMTALKLDQASNSARKKLMGNVSLRQTGAYSIAELARSDDYTSAQLPGAVILDEAKNVIRRARRYIAGRFAVVDARREVFDRLYEPAGFREIAVASSPQSMPDVEFITACAVIKDW